MDDPNITIEEYIRLEEEKAQIHDRINWQTTTFGKVKSYEDEDDCFINCETEFPAIVFDNTLTSDTKPYVMHPGTVLSKQKNKIGFRISLDESDDEDYTVIFDKNSFYYKIIYVNDLKKDSENDEILKPSSSELTVDVDYFKDFENEFPAIIYNDGLMSKSDLKIEPLKNPYTAYLLKELRDNTFSGSEHEDANEHIEKVLEIVDLFHIPKVTQDQILLRAFYGEEKTLEEAYYTQFGAPYQPGGQYRVAGPGFYQRNNENSSYPDRRTSLEESLTKFMAESAKRHEENSNIIKEIRASTDAAIRNQGASIKTLEIQIGQMSKVLQERGLGSLPSSTETNPRDQVKSILTVKADFSEICRIGCGPYADKDEGKSHAGTLIDIPVFVECFSIISGFTVIDDDDMTKKHCARNNTAYPRVWDTDLAETMIWYILKRTCVELIRAC
ncbi:hypothetical protein Tco_1395075 [Tanacetum coccineum]